MQWPMRERSMHRLKSDPLLLGLAVLAAFIMVTASGLMLSAIIHGESTPVADVPGTALLVSTVLLRASSVAAVLLAAILFRSARRANACWWLIGFLITLSIALLITSFVISPGPDGVLNLGRVSSPILTIGAVTIPMAAMLAAMFSAAFPYASSERNLFDLLSFEYSAGWPRVRLGRMHAKVVSLVMLRSWISICVLVGIILLSTLLFGFTRWLAYLVITSYVLPALWAAQILLAKYRAAEHTARERQALLWLAMGFTVGLWLWYPFGGITVLLVPDRLATAWLQTILAAAQTSMLMCLYIATFAAGAFDPGLVIRRSTIYGSLTMIVVFLSAVIEEVVSDLLLTTMGISSRWSVWITVGVIAVMLGAVHKKYSQAIEQVIDRIASKSGSSA